MKKSKLHFFKDRPSETIGTIIGAGGGIGDQTDELLPSQAEPQTAFDHHPPRATPPDPDIFASPTPDPIRIYVACLNITEVALFNVAEYTGTILTNLFGEHGQFAGVEHFWESLSNVSACVSDLGLG